MELGAQLGPQSRQINPPFSSRVEYQRYIHIFILHHKGYQWITKEWGIVKLESPQLHQECQK
jgi:hypothetical protein